MILKIDKHKPSFLHETAVEKHRNCSKCTSIDQINCEPHAGFQNVTHIIYVKDDSKDVRFHALTTVIMPSGMRRHVAL
jgi:hypothetical protein